MADDLRSWLQKQRICRTAERLRRHWQLTHPAPPTPADTLIGVLRHITRSEDVAAEPAGDVPARH